MEASLLIDLKDGTWNRECGRIHLDFHSAVSDESTARFLKLFDEQLPSCSEIKELEQNLKPFPGPRVSPAIPCIECISCPRYRIVATFTGRLRYSGKERGHAGFGHLEMFNLQLDVASVSDLDVKDTLASP
jgi:hypothetical protein